MRRELTVAADARRHLTSEQCGHGLTTAGKRDVVRSSRVDTRGIHDQPCEDMVSAAGGASTPGHRGRVVTQCADEALHVAMRRRSRHRDDFVLAREPGDRGDLSDRHWRLVPEDRAEHDEAVDEEHRAVAASCVDELGQADGSPRAGNVFHLDHRSDLLRKKLSSQRPRELIPSSARRGWSNNRQSIDCWLRQSRRGLPQHAGQREDDEEFHVGG